MLLSTSVAPEQVLSLALSCSLPLSPAHNATTTPRARSYGRLQVRSISSVCVFLFPFAIAATATIIIASATCSINTRFVSALSLSLYLCVHSLHSNQQQDVCDKIASECELSSLPCCAIGAPVSARSAHGNERASCTTTTTVSGRAVPRSQRSSQPARPSCSVRLRTRARFAQATKSARVPVRRRQLASRARGLRASCAMRATQLAHATAVGRGSRTECITMPCCSLRTYSSSS